MVEDLKYKVHFMFACLGTIMIFRCCWITKYGNRHRCCFKKAHMMKKMKKKIMKKMKRRIRQGTNQETRKQHYHKCYIFIYAVPL